MEAKGKKTFTTGSNMKPKPSIAKWKVRGNGLAAPPPPPPPQFVANPTRFFPSPSVPTLRKNRKRFLARRRTGPPKPHAPWNTTSFIMRAKNLGGIAPAVTPSPAVTPAILPTPVLSPGLRYKASAEDMNTDLGVDGYGSMNGLIRLRAYDDKVNDNSEEETDREDNGDQSTLMADRVEQRIDEGLSRFEMIYPSLSSGPSSPGVLESRLKSQDRLIAEVEEENLTLKERLFLVEQQVMELRQHLEALEKGNRQCVISGMGLSEDHAD